MPLSLDQAITQLDSGWLNHLQSEGYGGEALRQAVVLALYAQQQAAARNGSGFKAALKRVNGWLPQSFRCDNNGDYQFTADWHDDTDSGCSLSVDYAADPANWRLEFRLPGHWPHSTDNLDLTETRAVEHDFGLWLANAVHWCCAKLIEQQVGDEASPLWQQHNRAQDWAGFQRMNPERPSARVDLREVSADWRIAYPEAARASLQADFDDMAASLLRAVVALQSAAPVLQAAGR